MKRRGQNSNWYFKFESGNNSAELNISTKRQVTKTNYLLMIETLTLTTPMTERVRDEAWVMMRNSATSMKKAITPPTPIFKTFDTASSKPEKRNPNSDATNLDPKI